MLLVCKHNHEYHMMYRFEITQIRLPVWIIIRLSVSVSWLNEMIAERHSGEFKPRWNRESEKGKRWKQNTERQIRRRMRFQQKKKHKKRIRGKRKEKQEEEEEEEEEKEEKEERNMNKWRERRLTMPWQRLTTTLERGSWSSCPW